MTFDNAFTDFFIDPLYFGQPFYNSAPFYSGQGSALIQISFSGTTAFGMTYGSYFTQSVPIYFSLSNGDQFSTNLPDFQTTQAFFGFTSAMPITSVTVSSGDFNGSFNFDVLACSVGSSEPSSWAMLIAGFGLVGAAMRRRAQVIIG